MSEEVLAHQIYLTVKAQAEQLYYLQKPPFTQNFLMILCISP
jgi:hypothetical protein